jgi:Holliday junction resolvasome RuvABC endonuclease subunit
MTTLSLDLGTATGFAWGTKGAVASGTWDLRPKKYEGAGVRYLKFRKSLDEFHKSNPITLVTFEAVRRHLGTDAAHIYGGLMGTLEAWCEANGVPYFGVPVQTIKKYWTGKGNANKEAMIRTAAMMGFEVHDDNEADAIALLYYTIEAGGAQHAQEAKPPKKRRATAAPVESRRHVVR